MEVQRVVADDVYDVFLFPLQMLWCLFPSGLRRKLTNIPWETCVLVMKTIWALMFYYWLYTVFSTWIQIPSVVYQYLDGVIEYAATTYKSFWVWYSNLTLSSFSVLFPGFSILTWVSSKFSKRDTFSDRCQKKLAAFSNIFYVPERAIQGSELIPAKELPSFVCFLLGVCEDGTERFVGCGFRVENVIMTAHHNLTGYSQMKIVSNTATCLVNVEDAVAHPFDDFAYFRLSDRDFSILGMSKGKLLDHAVPKSYPVICQIYGPGTPVSFTMGAVTPVEQFGKVTYGGTTTYGFSGSPYVQNKTIVGMHLGAGMVNLGLDAAYMAMLVSIQKESTEEWLLDCIEQDQLNKRPVEYVRSPINPDEVQVKRQGKYFMMDADLFFSVHRPQSYVTECLDVKEKLPNLMYSDTKNDVTAPAHVNVGAGANGQTSAIRNCVQTPLTANSFQMPSQISDSGEILGMGHPEQMPVQQSSHLDCTSKNISYQPERNRRRVQQKNKKSNKPLQGSTSLGSPGLELIR